MTSATQPVTPQTHTIGFIGLGIMGRSMAGHILAAGYRLHVYSRTRASADALTGRGAVWHDSPAELAAACDVVITMVGYPADVEQVYFGEHGIFPALRQGGMVIDMTTSPPALAERIATVAAEAGALALDAPVSGGDIGARDATLAIMAGGEAAAFEAALPLLSVMGKTIRHMGEAGRGQHAKMVNQIIIAGTLMGVAEGLAYGREAGLDLPSVLEVLGGGGASSYQLNVLGKRMVEGDFAPGFLVHHFLKDMGIADAEASAMGLDLVALRTAVSQFRRYAGDGGRTNGTQGVYTLYTPAGHAPSGKTAS